MSDVIHRRRDRVCSSIFPHPREPKVSASSSTSFRGLSLGDRCRRSSPHTAVTRRADERMSHASISGSMDQDRRRCPRRRGKREHVKNSYRYQSGGWGSYARRMRSHRGCHVIGTASALVHECSTPKTRHSKHSTRTPQEPRAPASRPFVRRSASVVLQDRAGVELLRRDWCNAEQFVDASWLSSRLAGRAMRS